MRRKSQAAYFLVDISGFPLEVQQELIEGAALGGGDYGLRVVEEIHNGPARMPIYGVYFGDDEAKWADAKAELGIDTPAVEDENAVAAKAQAAADAEAERIRAAEAANVGEITGETADEVLAGSKNKNRR